MSLNRPVEPQNLRPDARPDLRGQYRKIGIGAVQAALRYCGDPKRRSDAPADPEPHAVRDLDPQAA